MEVLQKQLSLRLVFAFLPCFLFPASSLAQASRRCFPFPYKCGGVQKFNISYPFRTVGYPDRCSHPAKEFEIACNETDGSSEIEIQWHKYHVKMIDYENRTLTVVDKAFFGSQSDNNSCRLSSFKNTTLDSEFFKYYAEGDLILTFLHNCPSNTFEYYQRFRLIDCLTINNTGSYFTLQPEIPELPGECQVEKIPVLKKYRYPLATDPDPEAAWKDALANGFQITWSENDPHNLCGNCVQSKGHCAYNDSSPDQRPICYCDGQPHLETCPSRPLPGAVKSKRNKLIIAASTGAGIFLITCLLVLLIRKLPSNNSMFFWKKKTHESRNVEAFLENYDSLAPKRYRYSEIKKITNCFKENLGEGGYGSVFKGKLNDGSFVAVKVLNKSKGGNGEEFTNEVASISRTRHVNVVALLGFCFEGSKRALVYKFMSNGSLDKFIYSKNQGVRNSLDCQKLLDIALGIARGLEYLHRGCSTRILHLDIKPHNILLDDNFCPKISDFGLAKLCPGQQSTISMLDARGTVGYIAPEVFCRSIGGVSHKSDVYSYGMMVLEMIGGRKNVDARVDNISEIYFPDWVHKHINIQGSQGLFGFRTEEEEEIARKLVMVGLWCIQTNPANRPSMSRVVEMLEGSLGSLEMPPKPYLSSPSRAPSSTT